MTAMDFRHYDNALGRFNSTDVLAEAQFSHSPYHFSYNNPVFFADPSGLMGEGRTAVDAMWNNTANGTSSYWRNDGFGNFDNLYNSSFINSDGEYFALEFELDEVKVSRRGYFSGGLGGMMQYHTYSNSPYYQYVRDQWSRDSWDSFQTGMDAIGVVDPTGIVDGLNAIIYAARGQYANAAIAAIAIVPYVGDLAKVGKYGSKIAKYEKLADGFGTRAFIKEFNNTTSINTKILFNDITQGGTKKIINTPKGNIINATMSDGSIIQLRNFSTKSGDLNHSTIEFIGTPNKWKFNY